MELGREIGVFAPGMIGKSSSGGTTSLGSMARRPQYKVLMRTSSGAEQIDKRFLSTKSCGDKLMSAPRPAAKVQVARDSPCVEVSEPWPIIQPHDVLPSTVLWIILTMMVR